MRRGSHERRSHCVSQIRLSALTRQAQLLNDGRSSLPIRWGSRPESAARKASGDVRGLRLRTAFRRSVSRGGLLRFRRRSGNALIKDVRQNGVSGHGAITRYSYRIRPPIVVFATLTGRPWGRPTIESSIGRPAPCAQPPTPSRDESLFQSIPSRGAARILGRPRLRQRFSICCSSESGYPPVRSVLTLTMRILVGIVAPAAASVWTKPITRCRRFGLRRRRRATASYKDLRFFHRPRRSVLRYSHGRIVAVAFQLEGRSQWRWLFPFAHSLTPVTPAKLLFLPSFIAAKIGVCPPARRSPNHGHSSYFLVSP